ARTSRSPPWCSTPATARSSQASRWFPSSTRTSDNGLMDAGHDDDVVELGARRPRLPGGWRPSRAAAILAAATLAVGLAAGYAAGGRHATVPAPRVTVTVTATPLPAVSDSGIATPATAFPFAVSSALIQDVASCSSQTGHQLQLGVQVSNDS